MKMNKSMNSFKNMFFLSGILSLCAMPIYAETLVSPSEFEALSTGKTLYFSKDGQHFGTEAFKSGRRSKWRANDGSCVNGTWFSKGTQICFKYDNRTDTQCWDFLKTDNGYGARAQGAAPTDILELYAIDRKPLLCVDPNLAV